MRSILILRSLIAISLISNISCATFSSSESQPKSQRSQQIEDLTEKITTIAKNFSPEKRFSLSEKKEDTSSKAIEKKRSDRKFIQYKIRRLISSQPPVYPHEYFISIDFTGYTVSGSITYKIILVRKKLDTSNGSNEEEELEFRTKNIEEISAHLKKILFL